MGKEKADGERSTDGELEKRTIPTGTQSAIQHIRRGNQSNDHGFGGETVHSPRKREWLEERLSVVGREGFGVAGEGNCHGFPSRVRNDVKSVLLSLRFDLFLFLSFCFFLLMTFIDPLDAMAKSFNISRLITMLSYRAYFLLFIVLDKSLPLRINVA